jgi:GT2 family glycosyltransferase
VNPDCRLDPEAVRTARDALAADPLAAAAAPRLWRPGRELLDSAGIDVSPLILRARDRGRGAPGAGRFLEPDRVDAPCLAAALFRRTAIEQCRDGGGEVLDSRYFAYQEDVDLGFRIRRAGFHVLYEPRAVGEHDRGWREGRRRDVPVALRRLSLRNRWFTILKNLSWPGLIWRLPFLCAFELLFFAKLLVTEPSVLPGYAMALAGARGTIARRGLFRDARESTRSRS